MSDGKKSLSKLCQWLSLSTMTPSMSKMTACTGSVTLPFRSVFGFLLKRELFHHLVIFFLSLSYREPGVNTERLPDMAGFACLEAGNPPRNEAARDFEQINAFDSRYDHWHPSMSAACGL